MVRLWPEHFAIMGLRAAHIAPQTQWVVYGRNLGRVLLALATSTILANWGLRPYRSHLDALAHGIYGGAFGPNQEGPGPVGNFRALPESADVIYLAAYCYATAGHRASVVRLAMAAAITRLPPEHGAAVPDQAVYPSEFMELMSAP
jgi:hypothetical protein